MSFIPIIDLANSYQLNDWFLSAMILTLLLMLIIMGPYRYDYVKSFLSMFRFKSPDGDVSYPLLSTGENIAVFILSSICIGISVGIYSHDLMEEGFSQVVFLLWYSFLVVLCLVIKLVLYTVTNKILYKRQIIALKPGLNLRGFPGYSSSGTAHFCILYACFGHCRQNFQDKNHLI